MKSVLDMEHYFVDNPRERRESMKVNSLWKNILSYG